MKTSKLKINFYTCYIGMTGYAQHARNFVRALSKYADISVCDGYPNSNWNFDELDKGLLSNEIVVGEVTSIRNYLPDIDWKSRDLYPDDSIVDIDIVLFDEVHWMFYNTPTLKARVKMAFMVWESTKVSDKFFSALDKFDYFIVATQWHKDRIIEQGLNPDKIIIINEGVNDDVINTEPNITYDKFRYLIFGKWEYRKYTTELVNAFRDAFPTDNPDYKNIELIISADNPFRKDGLNTTQKCLEDIYIHDSRIKPLNFPKRSDYLSILSSGNVFLSCSRAEGWNIPLMEAMTIGIPCIYSNYGAQLEYAKHGLPVNYIGYTNSIYTAGDLVEPDYNDLVNKIKDSYHNYNKYLAESLEYSPKLKENFNWNKVAIDAISKFNNIITDHVQISTINSNNLYDINFRNGASVKILDNFVYKINFINTNTKFIDYTTTLTRNMTATTNKKYFIPWSIEIININTNEVHIEKLNLSNKRVLIKFESGCLGDTLAWIPYIEKFKELHNCDLYVYSNYRNLLENQYPDIKFVDIAIEIGYYAIYKLGWFSKDSRLDLTKTRTISYANPLQKTATDILGLNYEEIRPRINIDYSLVDIKLPKNKYICLGIQSTSMRKLWNNPRGWQVLTDYFVSKGYEVHVLSNEKNGSHGICYPANSITHEGNKNIMNTAALMKGASLFIGIGSGLSWLAWGLHTKLALISGFSLPLCEMSESDDVLRIYPNNSPCSGCFNREYWDRSWGGCPKVDNEIENFICTKVITPEYVISEINKKFNI